jgi:hypothetical protein
MSIFHCVLNGQGRPPVMLNEVKHLALRRRNV